MICSTELDVGLDSQLRQGLRPDIVYKQSLETRKGKDEEGNVVTDRQRDTMIKAKKDCHFEYNLVLQACQSR